MTDKTAVFLRGARDCFGVPALALTAALTGYGVLARENGLDLAVTLASVVTLWGLPAMMTFTEIVSVSGGPVLMAVTILLINIRTLTMVVAALPLIRNGRDLHWSHFIYAQFISPTNWAQIEAKQDDLGAAQRPPYFLGFSLVLWAGAILGTVLGYQYGAAMPVFLGLTFLFMTPFFVFLMMSTARRRSGQFSVALGVVLVSLAMAWDADWGMLVGGLGAGTIGFWLGRALPDTAK